MGKERFPIPSRPYASKDIISLAIDRQMGYYELLRSCRDSKIGNIKRIHMPGSIICSPWIE